MNKKVYTYLLLILPVVVSCSKMYDNLEKYAGETVYPGRFDTIIGRIGYERLEIDLMKAGRMPASEMKLGKATQSIIEYDGKTLTIDTLASWINLTDLKESKLYRIKAYTMDDEGNKSVPQEIALIPFTEVDLENIVIPSPQITTTPTSANISWPSGLSSVVLEYYSLKYAYKDKDSVLHKGEQAENPEIKMENLAEGETSVDIEFKVAPKINGAAILDAVSVSKTILVNITEEPSS